MELVNHSPTRRVGPLDVMDRGQYKGWRVNDIIRKSPQYIMYCIKEWLDVSPLQALIFEEVTGGGIIPDRFITSINDDSLVPTLGFSEGLVPNWDDCIGDPPEWWEEFKKKGRDLSPGKYTALYQEYVRKDFKKTYHV